MSIPPRKRKIATGSLRQIARRLRLPYRHTKQQDDGSRVEKALAEFQEKDGTSLADLAKALAEQPQ